MRALRKGKLYTYDDYCKWDDDERCELIDGEIYDMSPAPLRKHQRISGRLYRQLAIPKRKAL
jgi:Uma2 family endonuclease